MQELKASIVAMNLTPLTRNGGDRRLALEIQLETELPVPASVTEVRQMPANVQRAILEICSRLMMPMVEDLDDVAGFPDVGGVRVTLRSKPVNVVVAGVGTYQTLIFPQDRGCTFGW